MVLPCSIAYKNVSNELLFINTKTLARFGFEPHWTGALYPGPKVTEFYGAKG